MTEALAYKPRILASTVGMSREEWLQVRRRGIGSSDAAAIAGLNPWRSPMAVYLDKIGSLPPEEESEAAYWGTVLEEPVARRFAEVTGAKVKRRNAVLQHPHYPFMLANVDREIMHPERGRGLLECKTAGAHMLEQWQDGDRELVPDHYVIQVQHQLAVTGLRYAYIAALIGGQRFMYRLIERNDEMIAHLVTIESVFWRRVEERTPPPLDGTEADAHLLDLLYPEATPNTTIDLPAEALPLIEQYDRAKAAEKAARAEAEAAATQLKAMLGEAETGLIGDRKVNWRTIERKGYYVEPTKYRKFEVK